MFNLTLCAIACKSARPQSMGQEIRSMKQEYTNFCVLTNLPTDNTASLLDSPSIRKLWMITHFSINSKWHMHSWQMQSEERKATTKGHSNTLLRLTTTSRPKDVLRFAEMSMLLKVSFTPSGCFVFTLA